MNMNKPRIAQVRYATYLQRRVSDESGIALPDLADILRFDMAIMLRNGQSTKTLTWLM